LTTYPLKVCLIIPPSIFLLDERVFVSLGILKVAASLERAGYGVEVLDLSGVTNYEDVVRGHASRTDPDFFGVTSTTPQMPAAKKIRDAIIAARPDAHTILGGPHPTLVHAAARRTQGGRASRALKQLTDDWTQVVAGDGEKAILQVVGGDTSPIIDADAPASPLFLGRRELDSWPDPARHLVDLDTYHYTIDGERATSLIAQLGCPFKCAFCGGRYSPMLRQIRTRSKESIVAELEMLYRTHGYKGFMFYDDELNVNGKALVEMMDAITDLQSRLGVEFRLRGFVKSELFNADQAKAMRRAGFRWLLTGFESGAPRILTNIQKQATREDNTRCVETAREAGLKVKALMSIGHAGESETTCQQTEDWLNEVRPDDFDVTIITTYPGSPYYDDAIETEPGVHVFTAPKTGDKLYGFEVDYNKVADYYKGDPDGGYKAYVRTDHLTADDLVRIRGEMESRVRAKLGIPWNPSAPAQAYEHSMGQLPPSILRQSKPSAVPAKRVLDRAGPDQFSDA
jgi:radical SAM superfamily enzyme YgiQ (UPF0313 family)